MSGYIGPSPVPQSIQRRQSFTATAGQTTFGTTGYTDGDFIDVYLNGVKLVGGTDYTATNGTDIVLTTAASASDVLDFVTFNSFQLVDQTFTGQIEFDDGTAAAPSITNTGDVDTGIFFPAADTIGFAEGGTEAARIDSSGNLLVGKTSSDNGGTSGLEFLASAPRLYMIRDGGVPMEVGRLTSDGEIINLSKDGTTVGSIGTASGNPYIASTGCGFRITGASVRPTNTSGANSDNTVDLGFSSARWKDLYLSGGLYVGGTTSANYLDDYEEGTWTPGYSSAAGLSNITGFTNIEGKYVKIGDMVFAVAAFDITHTGVETIAEGDYIFCTGLPFAGEQIGVQGVYGHIGSINIYGSLGSNVNATGFAQLASTSTGFYYFIQDVNGALDTDDHFFLNFAYST